MAKKNVGEEVGGPAGLFSDITSLRKTFWNEITSKADLLTKVHNLLQTTQSVIDWALYDRG